MFHAIVNAVFMIRFLFSCISISIVINIWKKIPMILCMFCFVLFLLLFCLFTHKMWMLNGKSVCAPCLSPTHANCHFKNQDICRFVEYFIARNHARSDLLSSFKLMNGPAHPCSTILMFTKYNRTPFGRMWRYLSYPHSETVSRIHFLNSLRNPLVNYINKITYEHNNLFTFKMSDCVWVFRFRDYFTLGFAFSATFR